MNSRVTDVHSANSRSLHPWEIDADHPRIPLPRRIAATHYFNLGATEGRLRRLLKDFRFAPMSEVLGVH